MSYTISPLISIITVNYNQAMVTCELLESLKKLTYKRIEVIVVDNASKEDPTKMVKATYPNARVVLSNKNLGFAGGNNLGILASSGDFLFFVNNDTELTEDMLECMIDRFSSDADIGVVSPKIRYFYQPDVIQYAGYTAINQYTARNETIGNLQKDYGQFDKASETHYAHGAAMMVKKTVVDKVGMMPEQFFLYYEELDWCEQIKRAGYKIYFEPKALIYHKESMSVGKMSTLKTYYMARNRVLFMRRNASKKHFMGFVMFLIFFTLPKKLLVHLKKLEISHIKAFFNGLFWNLKYKRVQEY